MLPHHKMCIVVWEDSTNFGGWLPPNQVTDCEEFPCLSVGILEELTDDHITILQTMGQISKGELQYQNALRIPRRAVIDIKESEMPKCVSYVMKPSAEKSLTTSPPENSKSEKASTPQT